MVKVTLDAETFKALASPTRLTVLRALDQRRKTLTELAKDLDLNKATVLEHLTLLCAAGLVTKRDDEGRKWIYYELSWRGQRILHPEATTTFTVLIGLGVAAAGGGVFMLGRALEWWWADKKNQLIVAEDGDGASGASKGALDNSTAYESAYLVNDTSGEPPPSSPDAGGDPQEGQPDDGNGTEPEPSPSSPPPSPSPSPDPGQPSPGAPGPEPPQPATAAESGDNLTATRFADGADADGLSESSAESDASVDDSDGGWIALALVASSILFGTLAFLVRRKIRPSGRPRQGP